MKTLILASNNLHKVKEIKEILKGYKILTMKDIGFTEDIVEDGDSFLENSLIKAKAVSSYAKENGYHYDVIADDSGLYCDSLDGAPGIYSARYAISHDDSANRKKLIDDLKDKDKSAYFICVIVLYHSDGSYSSFEGRTYGEIISDERGKTDFGYDCIFLSDELGKTFGEVSDEEKNEVSHRKRALIKMKKELDRK